MSYATTTTTPPVSSTQSYYAYIPNIEANIIACVVFGVCTAIQCKQFMYRKQYFIIAAILFSLCECVGYIIRVIYIYDISLATFLPQLLLIILAPNFLSLYNYVILYKIIVYIQSDGIPQSNIVVRYSKWIPRMFVLSDFLSFLLQIIGGAQFASSNINTIHTGQDILLTGLAFQVAMVLVYVSIAIYVYNYVATAYNHQLRYTWLCQCITIVLLIIRNTYRMVEFGLGFNNYLINREVFYLIFDALLMAIASITICIIDHSKHSVLPNSNKHNTLQSISTVPYC